VTVCLCLIKQEEMKEDDKEADQSKPVSSTPVPGTPWYTISLTVVAIAV